MNKFIKMILMLVVMLFVAGCQSTSAQGQARKTTTFNPFKDMKVTVVKETYYGPLYYAPPVVIIDRSHYQSYGVRGNVYIQNGYGNGRYKYRR